MDPKRIAALIISIIAVELIGNIGSVFTIPAIGTWYAALSKPGFSPPNWLFAPVWTVLYALMGISLYLVWERGTRKKRVRLALSAFGAQLALNVLWSAAFFGLRSPFYGFVVIIALWIAILATTVLFYKVSKTAALLLAPYILWVTFAAYLNFSVWALNSGACCLL